MTKLKFVPATVGGETTYLHNYKNGCVLYLKSSVPVYKHVYGVYMCVHVRIYGSTCVLFFFKSLLNLLQYCFCFVCPCFGDQACEILALPAAAAA